MNIRDEIRLYAKDEDKPTLNWLFSKYRVESQWRFVARCSLPSCGTKSNREYLVWEPTADGRALYAYDQLPKELK